MDGCQITGACSSYARKYALNALLMIDDSKDSDDDSLSPKNPDNATERPATKADVAKATTAGTVTTTKVLPTATGSAVKRFLLTAMAGLREKRGISTEANNKLFKLQHQELVKAKLAPDKPADEYTMAEAEALIDAMSKCFDLTGTELKTE